jgi:hypothetical protein
MRGPLTLLSAFLLSVACSANNSTSASPDTGVSTAEGCPASITGSWTMTSTWCGGSDVGTDVTEYLKGEGGISQMLLVLGDTGTSCQMAGTSAGPTCTEMEEMELIANPDGTLVPIQTSGITSCEPAACKFNRADAPCLIGDRADQEALVSVTFEEGRLILTAPPPGGVCGGFGLATVATYQQL